MLTAAILFNPYTTNAENNKEILSPVEMKEDIDFLVEKIMNTYPTLINGYNDEQTRIIAGVYQKIQEPLPLKTFYYYANEIIVSLKCGHSYLSKPYMGSYYWLNIPFAWLDEGLFVTRDLGQYLKGDRSVSLGGKKENELFEGLRSIIPSENNFSIKYKAREELVFSWTLEHMGLVNDNGNIEVVIERNGNILNLETPLERKQLFRNKQTRNWCSWDIEIENSLGVFFLDRCGSGDFYSKELKKFFEEVKRNNIKNIALDLRNNVGGTNNCTFEFIEYLNVDEFLVYAYEIRNNEVVKARLMEEGKISERDEMQRDSRMRKNNKKEIVFDGNVFVLTSANTWSASTLWAYLFQKNNIGILVGEPTGNSPSNCGSIISYVLPNSRLTACIAYKAITWPGTEIGSPDSVYPDMYITTTSFDLKHNLDPQLEIIRKRNEQDSYKEINLFLDEPIIQILTNQGIKYKRLNTVPQNPRDITLIPLRGVLETFDASVIWDAKTKNVIIKRNNLEVILTIDSKIAKVNGRDIPLSEPTQIIKDTTLVPLRFISETVGLQVDWFEQEERIKIMT